MSCDTCCLVVVQAGRRNEEALRAVMSSAKRPSRRSGDPPMYDSLFGLDDRADAPRKAPRGRRSQPQAAQQESTAKKPKKKGTGQQVEESLVGALPGGGLVRMVGQAAQPAHAATQPQALNKSQWMRVQTIRLRDHWADQPDVTTVKIVKPDAVETQYFWLYWPDGLKVGWKVSDLNHQLQSGKLTFKQAGSDHFTTTFRD